MKRMRMRWWCAFSSASFSKCRSPSLMVCLCVSNSQIDHTCLSCLVHLLIQLMSIQSCNVSSMYTFGIVNKSQIILSTLMFSSVASFTISLSINSGKSVRKHVWRDTRKTSAHWALRRMCNTRRKSQNFQVCGFLTTQFVSVVGVVIIFTRLVKVCVKVTLLQRRQVERDT